MSAEDEPDPAEKSADKPDPAADRTSSVARFAHYTSPIMVAMLVSAGKAFAASPPPP